MNYRPKNPTKTVFRREHESCVGTLTIPRGATHVLVVAPFKCYGGVFGAIIKELMCD
jgi:hypothetical protein